MLFFGTFICSGYWYALAEESPESEREGLHISMGKGMDVGRG